MPSNRQLAHNDYLAAIEENAQLAHDALDGLNPKTPVPDCPGWPASELRDHISGVFTFWSHQLSRATTEGPDFPDSVREGYRRPILENAMTVIAALEPLGPNKVCWNWSGANMTTGWVARRMTHEIAVHRIDAQRTAGPGAVTPIASPLAVDGIDELLDVFVGPSNPASPGRAMAADKVETINSPKASSDPVLQITTPEAQWTLAIGQTAVPTDRRPDLTLMASAGAALLTLWGREAEVTWQGDMTVLGAWRALPAFGF